MRTTRLGTTGIETTALGFGCADLFRLPTRAARRRLLDAALDAGLAHFDAAPMYGLGEVEGELGRALSGRRDRVVLATKFGIEPTALARSLGVVQAPLQQILRRVARAEHAVRPRAADPRAGRVGAVLYRAAYDPGAARASLERSLRALRTDYVDLYLVHDPEPGSPTSDGLRGYLEEEVRAGRVRSWGVAGEPAAVAAAARALAPVPVTQTRSDILEPAEATIVFGAVGRALARIRLHLRDDERRHAWSKALDTDLASTDMLARLLVADALRRSATVLVSTTIPGRVARLAGAETVDDAAVDALRKLVGSELA